VLCGFIEYTKAMEELQVMSLDLTINLYMNHIQSTKMYIKVITNTLLFLIHLKVKETMGDELRVIDAGSIVSYRR
jgi:hypothetical protein